MADASVPEAWFTQGDMDLQAAELLLSQDGPPTVVAFHIQQTIEKYLKGYLLSVGDPLRRIHDLEVLLREAIAHDVSFTPFLSDCQRITEYGQTKQFQDGANAIGGFQSWFPPASTSASFALLSSTQLLR